MKALWILFGVVTTTLLVAATVSGRYRRADQGARRPELEQQMAAGNFKDAYEGYRRLLLAAEGAPELVGDDLQHALDCLEKLGRVNEIDALRDQVIERHGANWRLLAAAARSLLDADQQFGFLIGGKFERGPHRGGGAAVSSAERDRARALQLLVRGLDGARQAPDKAAAGKYFLTLAEAVLTGRTDDEAWRLQSLTPLDSLPDYDERTPMRWRGFDGGSSRGAPAGPDGAPIYHTVPESFERAVTDGERWRWALAQAPEIDPGLLNRVRWDRAQFALSQFGTQTVSGDELLEDAREGPFALTTLKDDETIARLANGVKRFTLPEDQNFIALFLAIADDSKTGFGENALGALASVFTSRRQFDRAAEMWRRSVRQYGDPNTIKQRQIDQIVGNWGQFEPVRTAAAGRGATVDYQFRNGRRVRFEARRVDVKRLIEDMKTYLKSNPERIDWQNTRLGDIGHRLVVGDGARYVGAIAATWSLDLEPEPGHFDKRVTVTTPLQAPGAYLVTAAMEDGNTTRIVVWVDDTVIVKKPLEGSSYYFVADARTGQPIAEANVELFGWRQRQIGQRNQFRVETKSEARTTDAEGQLIVPANNETNSYQWLITARGAGDRFAYLGFTNVWFGRGLDSHHTEARVFTITDRPVYRPGSPVRFKFWVAQARYDGPETSAFADKTFRALVLDPKGEKVLERTFKTDAFGGFDGTYELPSDAALGTYRLVIADLGGGTFRVEEYKKPEFEVTVEAPTTPVMLGEKVPATIKASYYFGGPVTQGTVKYKVTRTEAVERPFPVGRWDWLYGAGYWWFGGEYAWYPGWSRWGFSGWPTWWLPRPTAPPEVVADAEVPIGPDGTIRVEIDTALAKALHPDQDHRYQITAEVTDQSRRTIVGGGTVLAARQPFSVYAWLDRGHYRAGDTIRATVSASTLDRKPVKGEGTLKLLKITYDAQRRPVETVAESWGLTTDDQGRFEQAIKAAAPGQYRLSAEVSDGQGHTIEGGYLFVITGEGFDGSNYRFNDLEVIPDQKDYRVGETIRLLISTNQPGATVLLFTRPMNGVYLPPKIVRLRGKTTVETLGVAPGDMPNLFVEAVTIANGKVHEAARNIAVPPEKRVVDVKVEPSSPTYKPGQKAKVRFTLTGADGKPFVGSTVVSVYDKAVEYIAGGSNVPDIKEFFWKWVRHHYPRTESSLDETFHPIVKPNEITMQPLDPMGEWAYAGMGGMGGAMGGMGGAGRDRAMRGVLARSAPMPAAAAAAPMEMMGLNANQSDSARRKAGEGGAGFGGEGFADLDDADGENLAEPTVRTNFADTAYWNAAITTNDQGSAEVEFDLPESLTTWKAQVWGMGGGTRVGQGSAELITTKDILVRLQAPRFFVEKDEVVLSANVHNKLDTKQHVQVVLELDGSELEALDETARSVEIESGGEQRVDWRVKVAHEGDAVIRMKALTAADSDAVRMSFPVLVHGMLKQEAVSGAIRPADDSAQIAINVPTERRPEQTRLEVRFSPTLAGAMVDALPYLANYPYGCTEQTLNRFLPTVITQRTLQRMGISLKTIRDKRTNLNAQELGDPQKRAEGWKRFPDNPVFDEAEVTRMANAGIQRLADMQLSSGGWGWFSGFGEYPSAHTTALVVHGLQLAKQNDLTLPEGVIERGAAWLTAFQAEQTQRLQNASGGTKPYKQHADDLDALVFMVLTDAGAKNEAMLVFLDRDRTKLSVYGKALFGLACARLGDQAKLTEVMRNLRQYVVEDTENQTAYLKLPNEGYWWFWQGSEIETHAFTLKLLALSDPKGELAPKLVKYLLNNRKHGTYWQSTRDTAFCIEAMADFLQASGEDRPDMTVKLAVDGEERKAVKITSADLFTFDNALLLEGAALGAGKHTVTVSREGRGPVYFNAYLTNFTLEDPITSSGLEIKVERRIYKLVRDDKSIDVAGGRGQAVGQRVERYKREPLGDEAVLESGDLVEVELEIASKNDYEYLVFEDFKAAGFEPVEVRSGYNGNSLGAYVEFRDERVAFFVRALARGSHSVSYRLRAEVPGRFHALPARGYAMYAPELKANSDEVRLTIED